MSAALARRGGQLEEEINKIFGCKSAVGTTLIKTYPDIWACVSNIDEVKNHLLTEMSSLLRSASDQCLGT